MLNSATTIPSEFLPVERQVILVLSPVLMASSTAISISFPWLQLNNMTPVAFLKNLASIPSTNILTLGDLWYTCEKANIPLHISAAIASTAKYMDRKGF